MLGLNNIQIIGNLGGAPDMKFLDGGRMHVVNFSVAVNERWKNRNDEPQERTTWLRVVAFNGLGQTCAEHLTKGDGVYVEGRLQVREYEDKDGNERTSVEVVASRVRFLGRGNNGNGDERRPAPGQPRTRTAQQTSQPSTFDQSGADDDVPF
ncbi:MAG: single-stranded DNA-binding protein [Bryobacteraceae bacterium]|nr:single-stranded DNA-binding protein [Bryobacteraceae bacterium]